MLWQAPHTLGCIFEARAWKVTGDPTMAKAWFHRGAEQGDRECLNGLGIMNRDGLGLITGIKADMRAALTRFNAAAGQQKPELELRTWRMASNEISDLTEMETDDNVPTPNRRVNASAYTAKFEGLSVGTCKTYTIHVLYGKTFTFFSRILAHLIL